MIKPQKFREQILRPQLEERLEGIILGAALLADSSSTREDRRDRIIQECNAVRQALQELLEEYIQYVIKNLIIFEILLFVCFSRKRKVQMKM